MKIFFAPTLERNQKYTYPTFVMLSKVDAVEKRLATHGGGKSKQKDGATFSFYNCGNLFCVVLVGHTIVFGSVMMFRFKNYK